MHSFSIYFVCHIFGFLVVHHSSCTSWRLPFLWFRILGGATTGRTRVRLDPYNGRYCYLIIYILLCKQMHVVKLHKNRKVNKYSIFTLQIWHSTEFLQYINIIPIAATLVFSRFCTFPLFVLAFVVAFAPLLAVRAVFRSIRGRPLTQKY